MDSHRCFYCYQKLNSGAQHFHRACSKAIFGKVRAPVLDYSRDEMLNLAEKVIQSQVTVPGVQAKLSLGLRNLPEKDKPAKLTIVGVWGSYILKPPSQHFPHLPELEDLTMHLARLAGINTVPHTLVPLRSGELSYLTKRVDRIGNQKLHMEDMCQLTNRLTEQKYRGSYEQIAKHIAHFSSNPGFDILSFYEQVLFAFLTGNNDMHFKNFSLLKYPNTGYSLSPAYDHVAAALVVEGDDEELALTLNGKKKKIAHQDFLKAMSHYNIDKNAISNIFKRFEGYIPKWHEFIEQSFLPDHLRNAYRELLSSRAAQIEMSAK